MENLLALAVLMFVLLGLAVLASTIIASNAATNKRITAITLAQDKIEDIRRAGYDATLGANSTVTENYKDISQYPFFKRVTLTQVNTPAAGLQTVTVTVYWDADARMVTLTTLVAQ